MRVRTATTTTLIVNGGTEGSAPRDACRRSLDACCGENPDIHDLMPKRHDLFAHFDYAATYLTALTLAHRRRHHQSLFRVFASCMIILRLHHPVTCRIQTRPMTMLCSHIRAFISVRKCTEIRRCFAICNSMQPNRNPGCASVADRIVRNLTVGMPDSTRDELARIRAQRRCIHVPSHCISARKIRLGFLRPLANS